MSISDDTKLDTCGCCEGIMPRTRRYNRPGKPAIDYRLDTHTMFLRRMIARLHTQSIPDGKNAGSRPLTALTTRATDDPAIAIMDAWAVVADVLTFYQERIANECFLNTATERRSVMELASAIGYELKPGVAASTYLAFTLEDVPGAPGHATIGVGTKVMSVPGQDEKPQTFETIERIEALAEWNALKPRMTEPKTPGFGAKEVYLKGVTTGLKPGDWLLFVGEEREQDPGSERWDFRQVKTVTADPEAGHTKVTWGEGLGWERSGWRIPPAQKNLQVYAFHKRAALFGYNAPDWRAMPDSVKNAYLGLASDTIVSLYPDQWPNFNIVSLGMRRGLYAEYFDTTNLTNRKVTRIDSRVNFDWGTGSPDPAIGSNTFSARWAGFVQPECSGRYTFYTCSDDGVRLWVDDERIINNWTDHHPTEDSGMIDLEGGRIYDIKLEYYEKGGGATIQLYWSGPCRKVIIPKSRLYPPSHPYPIDDPPDIHLDSKYPQILQDSWLVLSIPEYQELYQVETVSEDARSDFTLTAKTTRVTLKGENLSRFDDKLRETAVFAQSELMGMAEAPITYPITNSSIVLDRIVDGLTSGQLLIVSGEEIESGEPYSEVVTLLKAKLAGDVTKIVFDSPLLHSYKRDTVTVYANVARATHGETVHEVLGSGSAAGAHQRFTLKKPPLTYVSASTPSGTLSTLAVRVNGVQWQEEPSLYGLDTRSQSYIVRIDDDAATKLVFGDGKNGARLPTGVENVTAAYRSGIGLGGEVSAGSLTLLMTRPLGVRSVTNPLPASGAESPEKLSDARQNAPVTVLTLDRIVSLRDFENLARSFAGIGKAQASALKMGQSHVVHITVAAANGSEVDSESKEDLCDAIDAVRDPIERVYIDSFQLRTFTIEADILIDERHLADDVMAEVKATLWDSFSFENRDFGQPVTAAEVLSIMQAVDGVVAVDLNMLELDPASTAVHESVSPTTILPSKDARVEGGAILPAELLLLNPDTEGVTLTELKI